MPMASLRRLQNSVIERFILRHAEPFLSDIELEADISTGAIHITNMKMKEGTCFFETVEQLLVNFSIDVWGVNGLPMIWPHGVEITSAVIRKVEIKLPTPNPFNGDMWKITVDGVDGEVRTLTSERKSQIARKARHKALEEAEKRLKMANIVPVLPSNQRYPPYDAAAADDSDSDDGDISEGGLAKQIDRYFKEHLDISFNNAHVILRTVEDEEVPEACWYVRCGRMNLDLGVDEIDLPQYHHKRVSMVVPSSPWGRGVPPDIKLFEEKIGLAFLAIHLEMRRSPKDPPVMVLDFPNRMMNLHLVRKQWPECITSLSNGFDRIHVELPDDFTVHVHLDQDVLRGSVIGALHQIFDGVAMNVPNWVDWISVPCPDGWTREGRPTPPKEDPKTLMDEYLSLLGKSRPKTQPGICSSLFESCKPQEACSNSYGSGNSSRGSHRNRLSSSEFLEVNERLEWFMMSQTTEWLAYCRNLSESMTTHPQPPETGKPLTTWLVVPWRRYEISLQFHASFAVKITSGEKREERMMLQFPANMAAVLVRDLPAEWTVCASIPALLIFTAGIEWLTLSDISMQLCWGRRDLLKPHRAEKIPADVPSVCRIAHLKVSSVAVLVNPPVAITLLPILAQLPEVLLWPELRYFFGEWGYMPRPMAYVVDAISIKDISVNVSSEEVITAAKRSPDAEIALTVTTVDISSGGEAIYMDKNWEAWWGLSVHIGDTHISTHLQSLHDSLFTSSAVGLKTARKSQVRPRYASLTEHVSGDEDMPVCTIDVNLMSASLVVSPDAILCLAKLAATFSAQCKDLLLPVALSVADTFYKCCGENPPAVPELPSWIWPCALSVRADEVQPLRILVKHSLSNVLQVKTSFLLDAVLQEQVIAYDSAFLVVSLTPARVCIECFDEEGSEAWEPLLEPWDFEFGIQLHLPPKPRLKVLLAQATTAKASVELDVSSTPVMVARSLFFAYVPVLKMAIESGVTSEAFCIYLEKTQLQSRRAALNLTGTPIMASLVYYPRTVTDVAVKMQSIFRASRSRRNVKKMMPKTPNKTPSQTKDLVPSVSYFSVGSWTSRTHSQPNGSNSIRGISRSKSHTMHGGSTKYGIALKSGEVRPLAMGESQRLSISMKYLPRDLPEHPHRSDQVSARKILPKAVTGSLTQIRKRKDHFVSKFWAGVSRLHHRPERSVDNNSEQRRQISPSSHGNGSFSDVTRLMNICNHRQTAVIPASDGKQVAYICEVVSPSVNDRILLVQSPFRVFNYTSSLIDICFTNGVYQLDVEDYMVQGCSCASDTLGVEQPLDPIPYGLPAPDLKGAMCKDNAWRLPGNCFASIPPQLRHPDGGLMLRMRSETCTNWNSATYDVGKLKSGDMVLYRLPNGDTIRVIYSTHKRFESAIVLGTGHRVTCCDICFVPCLSVLSMCPLALEVELDTKGHRKEIVMLEPGKTNNFYRHVHVNIKLRFAGGEKWSHVLSHIDSRDNAGKEELVTLPSHEGAASTEVHLKLFQSVCIISSPLWFIDKTQLGLRCTDKKGQDFPRAGPFFLPASKGETFLVLKDVNQTGSNAISKQADREVRELLPRQFFRKSTSDVLMQAPPSLSYPLKITSKHMDHLFAEFQQDHVPTAQLLCVMPGLMVSSTLPLSVRFNGGEPLPIPANEATPIWPEVSGRIPNSLQDLEIELQVDEESEWSKPIKCSNSLTGVYSLAMASSSVERPASKSSFSRDEIATPASSTTSEETASAGPVGPVRTVSAEISDAVDTVLSFHVSEESDQLSNMSSFVELAAVETDSPESHAHRGWRKRRLHLRTERQINKLMGNEVNQLPTWAFSCPTGETVGIGWFQPFSKDKADNVKLYLRWAGESQISGAVDLNLHSTIIYVFLRPASSSSDGKSTVARVRQHKQRRCIQIYDEDYIPSQAGFHVEEVCGVCGYSLAEVKKESDVKTQASSSIGLSNILNVSSWMGSGAAGRADKSNLTNGKIKCKNCSCDLAVPGFDLFGTSRGTESLDRERIVRKRDALANAAKSPLATILSCKRWLGCLVADCNLTIPSCGISVISKRSRREVLYCLLEGILISFQAPDGFNTHVMRLQVQGVRCDRFDVVIGYSTPSVVASTVAVPKGQDPVAVTPALDVTIVRQFVSAFDIFLREATANFYHNWEVNVDTEILNDLCMVGDECTKGLGQMEKQLYASMAVVQEPSGSVFDRLQHLGRQPLNFTFERAGRVIQMENYDASDIDVKIWLKLRLNELKFIPAEVRRIFYFFGNLVMPSLSGTKLHIERKKKSMIRGSIVELGRSFRRLYSKDIGRAVRNLLSSAKIMHHDVSDAGLEDFQANFLLSSSNFLGSKKADALLDSVEEDSQSPEKETKSTLRRGMGLASQSILSLKEELKAMSGFLTRTSPKVPEDHPDPACCGEPWLRLPRLLLARGLVTHYDEFHAQVQHAMGKELLEDCLQIFKIKETPLHLLIVTCDRLIIATMSDPAFFHAHHSLTGSQHVKHVCDILHQWSWEEVRQLDLSSESDDMEILISAAGEDIQVAHSFPCCLRKDEKSVLSNLVRRFLRRNETPPATHS